MLETVPIFYMLSLPSSPRRLLGDMLQDPVLSGVSCLPDSVGVSDAR